MIVLVLYCGKIGDCCVDVKAFEYDVVMLSMTFEHYACEYYEYEHDAVM